MLCLIFRCNNFVEANFLENQTIEIGGGNPVMSNTCLERLQEAATLPKSPSKPDFKETRRWWGIHSQWRCHAW